MNDEWQRYNQNEEDVVKRAEENITDLAVEIEHLENQTGSGDHDAPVAFSPAQQVLFNMAW